MSIEFIVTLVLAVGVTVPIAVGGVLLGRNTYYKSLPARIAHLEDQDLRNQAALKRQSDELALWKGVATQTPEIRELITLFGRHHEGASERFFHIETQHDEILNQLSKIKDFMDKMDRKIDGIK